MRETNIFKLTYLAIRYGDWSWGWATKNEWPTKHQFGVYTMYHDGYYWSLHIGPFYLNAEF